MYSIRKANTDTDLEIVKELDAICFDGSRIKTDGAEWWIAYYYREPVGYAGIRPSSSFYDAGYLCRAGVLPDHRGNGLQKKLIRTRIKYAKRQGWTVLRTDTRDNPESSNSLISCGFKLFSPSRPWAFKDSLYWIRRINN
jgi:GNAT superfamily N-acetyltransferase